MRFDIENAESLMALLEKLGKIKKEEKCSVEIMGGGVSNKTVLFSHEGGDQWVIKQALTKLRVEQDWFCDPGRLQVEYKAMEWFLKVLPEGAVPEPIFFDEENNVLAMKAIARPHDNLKSILLKGEIRFDLIRSLGYLLAGIHNAGRSIEAKQLFHDRDFFITLRMDPYYKATASRLPETGDFFQNLINDTLATQLTVVHGDFSPKNILVKDGTIILLDHEVMHIGDPCFDIGFCLTHLLSKANFLKQRRSQFIEATHLFWKSYSSRIHEDFISRQTESRAVRHTIGCLLARVEGRSPLEYLDKECRQQQVKAALNLMHQNISTIPGCVDAFRAGLDDGKITGIK